MLRNKTVLIILLLFGAELARSQPAIKNFVQANTAAIRSIEPDSVDYSDLAGIGEAIGDARVVMLGEQDHGDAATFLAKSRLVKYLHEVKGFNVLAFESDFFGLNFGWEQVEKGRWDVDRLINKIVTGFWSRCKDCDNLFSYYIPQSVKTDHPLKLAGFDNQINTRVLATLLDSVMRAYALPVTRRPDYESRIVPSIINRGEHVKDSTANRLFLNDLEEIRHELDSALGEENLWSQSIVSVRQDNLRFVPGLSYYASLGMRDEQMARNLRWLVTRGYPREKIIVWAHSYHISKYNGHYPESSLNAARTMGAIYTGDTAIEKETYILGFTSFKGEAGRLGEKRYPVPKPRGNSFESWMPSELPYAFVDFRKYNRLYPAAHEVFYMAGGIKGNWFHTDTEAEWNRVFDGVLYIREMRACTLNPRFAMR